MSNKSNEEVLSKLESALNHTPDLGAELIEVQTAIGPKKAVAASASAFFYRVQNNRYAGNVAINTELLAGAVDAGAGLLIGVWPLALCETKDGHVVGTKPMPKAEDGTMAFVEVPAKRVGGVVEPKKFEHPKYGTIVELGLTGAATKEGLVAAWLSPAATRSVAKAVVEAKAGEFRPTLWLRLPDEVASPEAAEAAKTESGVSLEDAEAATDTGDEVTD